MSTEARFNAKMWEAGAIPYRKGGRVRVAYTQDTPPATLEAMRAVVRKMAETLSDKWKEPTPADGQQWMRAGLRMLDVCDEPCPQEVKLTEVGVDWLVARCARYHFRLQISGEGNLEFVGVDGYQRDDREGKFGPVSGFLSLTPKWFLDALNARKAEIVNHLQLEKLRVDTPTGGE